MIITMKHVRASKMCSGGTRSFFLRYDIDWVNFLNEGVDEKVLLETGDAMAKQVVDIAHGR